MTEFRPRFERLPSAPRAFWRRPAVWSALVLLVLLIAFGMFAEPSANEFGVVPPAADRDSPSAWERAIEAAGLGPARHRPTPTLQPEGEMGRMLVAEMELRPRFTSGLLAGYVVSPRGRSPLLADAGLRAGDIIIELDGQPLDPSREARLADELAQVDAVEITFERGGQVRKRLVDFAR